MYVSWIVVIRRDNCFQNITFHHNLRIASIIACQSQRVLFKNLTPLTQIYLYSQCNLHFLLYLHSEYGGGASLKACTVAYRPFLLVYSTESVENHSGVMCDTHLGFDQTDLLSQFIQDVKTNTTATIRIYKRGMYWLSPTKDI